MTESKAKKHINIKRAGLRKNFNWMLTGTVVSAMGQMLLVIVIQKMLGTKSLGEYTFALSISLPVFLFTGLSFNRMIVIDVENSHSFQEYFGVRIFLNFISLIVVLVVGVLSRSDFRLLIIIGVVAVYHSIFMLSTLAQGVFQKNECMNFIAISRIIQSVISISSMFIGLFVTKSLIGGLVILCVVSIVKFFLYDLNNVKKFDYVLPEFNMKLLKQMFNKCWLISISGGIVSFTGNLPKYLIKSYIDTKSLGFFTGISTTTIGMNLVVVTLMASAIHRLAVYYSQSINKFVNLFIKLTVISVGFGLANILFILLLGKYFLKIFFDETYLVYLSAMSIYAVAGIILALVAVAGDTIISTRHYWWRIFASIAAILSIFIGGRYLVPLYGFNGVIVVCVLGFGLELLVCIFGLFVLSKRQHLNHLELLKNGYKENIDSGEI